MMQNIMLCKKKKVNMMLASFTDNPWKMRGQSEIEGLGKEMGLVKNSFNEDKSWELITNLMQA